VRKLVILWPVEGFFELHSTATEAKKDKEWVQKDIFKANQKCLNEFI